ncbi:MAG: HflK protein [Gammaproteobacteria bacterium RBG_16_57_12]|nr:MAG: HflK protein [Gammaproteobacteria bacterium RBG_16_57_12]
MAWNEPGGGNKDPWGSRRGEQGPPDLDAIIKKFQEKLGKMFGGSGGGRAGGSSSGDSSASGVGMIITVLVVGWLAYDMSYIIDQGEQGVVLRFGSYVDTIQPGPNIRFPRPIEKVVRVDMEHVRPAAIGYRMEGGAGASQAVDKESLMLTQDENIVDIKLAVQYKIKSAKDYIVNVANPDNTLRQVTESSLREVIGKSNMDFVLTEGRGEIGDRTRDLMQKVLDQYGTGIHLTSVNLQDAQPPEQVQSAFADAVRAREDEERLKNKAQAYANDILPRARGAAARQLEEATAYKAQVIAEAEGEAKRFTQVLKEYEKAPEVTRKRLYLDAMEKVLSNSSKVLVTSGASGSNITFIPLDRFLSGNRVALPEVVPGTESNTTSTVTEDANKPLRDNQRGRGER